MMEMIADGEGITLTLTGAVPFPGVRLLSIADEPEAARFSGIWSPANRIRRWRNSLRSAISLRVRVSRTRPRPDPNGLTVSTHHSEHDGPRDGRRC
jgi:hypothetical protein